METYDVRYQDRSRLRRRVARRVARCLRLSRLWWNHRGTSGPVSRYRRNFWKQTGRAAPSLGRHSRPDGRQLGASASNVEFRWRLFRGCFWWRQAWWVSSHLGDDQSLKSRAFQSTQIHDSKRPVPLETHKTH